MPEDKKVGFGCIVKALALLAVSLAVGYGADAMRVAALEAANAGAFLSGTLRGIVCAGLGLLQFVLMLPSVSLLIGHFTSSKSQESLKRCESDGNARVQ